MELLTKTQPAMIVPTAIRLRKTERAGLSIFFGTHLKNPCLRARPDNLVCDHRGGTDAIGWADGLPGYVILFSPRCWAYFT